jgi:O-methyltransferase involved in polyketide biosynthesis
MDAAMTKLSLDNLSSEAATLLGCLWARAEDAGQPDSILRDVTARQIVDSLDFDFQTIRRSDYRAAEICIRATLIDSVVRNFLSRHPSGTVVELGVGLDSRSDRLDTGESSWIEMDLPHVMELRRKFFAERPRRHFIESSMLAEDWLDVVQARRSGGPVLFVAEGVLYWIGEGNVRMLFDRLATRFPASAIVFDTQSPLFVRYTHWRVRKFQQAKIQWAISDPRQIEKWDSRFSLERNIRFGDSPEYDPVMNRLPWHMRLAPKLFPPVRRFFQVNCVRFSESAIENRAH